MRLISDLDMLRFFSTTKNKFLSSTSWISMFELLRFTQKSKRFNFSHTYFIVIIPWNSTFKDNRFANVHFQSKLQNKLKNSSSQLIGNHITLKTLACAALRQLMVSYYLFEVIDHRWWCPLPSKALAILTLSGHRQLLRHPTLAVFYRRYVVPHNYMYSHFLPNEKFRFEQLLAEIVSDLAVSST